MVDHAYMGDDSFDQLAEDAESNLEESNPVLFYVALKGALERTAATMSE